MGSAKGTCKRYREATEKTLGLNSQGWKNVTVSFVRDESVGVGLPGRSCVGLRRCFPKLGTEARGTGEKYHNLFFMYSDVLPGLPVGQIRSRLINETLQQCTLPTAIISTTANFMHNVMSLNWNWEESHTIESYKLVWTGSSSLLV